MHFERVYMLRSGNMSLLFLYKFTLLITRFVVDHIDFLCLQYFCHCWLGNRKDVNAKYCYSGGDDLTRAKSKWFHMFQEFHMSSP